AAGMVLLRTNKEGRAGCMGLFEQVVREEGQFLLGWREVPTDNGPLGLTACAVEPIVRQILIGRSGQVADEAAFERKLYVIRKRVENAVRASDMRQRQMFYVLSRSYKTLIYKGMLNEDELPIYYPDLH